MFKLDIAAALSMTSPSITILEVNTTVTDTMINKTVLYEVVLNATTYETTPNVLVTLMQAQVDNSSSVLYDGVVTHFALQETFVQ